MKLSFVSAAASAASALVVSSAVAAPAVVTTQVDFNNAVGNVVIQTETFPNAIAGAVQITFDDSGVVSTAVGGDPVFNGDNAVLFPDTGPSDGGGEWFTAIGPSGVSPTTITWLFPTDIVGFFADFESATFAQFEVLDSSDNVLGTVKISDFIPPPQFGSSNGPLGVVDLATPFNQIRWSAIPGVNFELFGVNSFQYTDGTPAPDIIPLPAPALMLVSGIVALGALRVRLNAATGS